MGGKQAIWRWFWDEKHHYYLFVWGFVFILPISHPLLSDYIFLQIQYQNSTANTRFSSSSLSPEGAVHLLIPDIYSIFIYNIFFLFSKYFNTSSSLHLHNSAWGLESWQKRICKWGNWGTELQIELPRNWQAVIEPIPNNLQSIVLNFPHVARKSLDILISKCREFPIVPFLVIQANSVALCSAPQGRYAVQNIKLALDNSKSF